MTASLRTLSKYLFAAVDRIGHKPEGPRILIYHQVGTDLGRQMEVTLADFQTHMGWLASHYEVVALDEALRRWEEPGADRLAVITFDDGYVDTYEVAYEVLTAANFPFTVYVASEQVESSSNRTALNWGQIDEMLGSGLLTVGAHTHTHADLRGLNHAEVGRELDISDRLIEERTGVRPRHFAYPWGYWSANAHEQVRARYESAVLGGSPRASRPLDIHKVPRFPVQKSDGRRFFEARLRGGLLGEEWLRRAVRGYRGP